MPLTNGVVVQLSAVLVAIAVSTHNTLAPPISSPLVYVVPSTGAVVIALVEARIRILVMSAAGGVVYEMVAVLVLGVAIRVAVLLLRKMETEAEPGLATARSMYPSLSKSAAVTA